MSETEDKAATEWAAAWRVICRALKEMGVSEIEHNAASIMTQLANEGMSIVHE